MNAHPIVAALLVMSLAATQPVFAKTSSAKARAAEEQALLHYEAGTNAYNAKEYARAVEEYKAAYRISPEPVLLYNIAQSYRLANDAAQAIVYYRLYVRSKPNAPNRADIEEKIRRLEPSPSPQASAAPSVSPSPSPGLLQAVPTIDVANTGDTRVATRGSDRGGTTPLYKKWWLWTIVGVGVVGAALGVGLGVGLNKGGPPSSALGTTLVF